ncbi:MAG: DUF4249 family protein [Bacteroidia bacterium]|jgi:hypothetical protein
MRKYSIPFLFVLAAITFTSCKEEIELDIPGGEPKLVVEAEITTETDSSYVMITKTADYYSLEPIPKIAGATVMVNGIAFNFVGEGIYKPASPYTGVAGQTYDLNIVLDGKTYTSTSQLEKMFRIDSVFQVFKPKSGFIDAGWSINYLGFDDRPKIKYTYFRLGYFDTIVQRDSFSRMKILFNSEQTPLGTQYAFELPFTRFQKGEECVMIFRSVDKFMNGFISAYIEQSSGPPGPFQSPPANLPTNITGGAIGYFATYDIIRKRYTVK